MGSGQLSMYCIVLYCCSKLEREGVKIISQTENVVKEITVNFSFSC